MIVAYASLTGKVKSFAERLQIEVPEVELVKIARDTVIEDPFVLITYTFGSGDIPREVNGFMDRCGNNIIAVAGSGERNWGTHRFCKASIDISNRFNVPLLHTFEKSGFDSDVAIVATKIKELLKGR